MSEALKWPQHEALYIYQFCLLYAKLSLFENMRFSFWYRFHS